MRKIKEVLRLKFEVGRGQRQIARSCAIGKTTVAECLARFERSELSWPQAAQLDEATLERTLYPPAAAVPAAARAVPNWPYIHQELRRKGVTLTLLWYEYKAAHPEGFEYSWFCDRYRAWAGTLDLVMRQEHRAGEKLFVDYAGQTAEVVDRRTGEIRQAQIFVAVLGASNYTYAEATWSQQLPDWIGSHVRAFEFLGGSSEILVPDNLRSGVSKAHRYEPDLNPTYADLANHYGVAVLPARARKPRDKAKAEAGVLLVERWILAVLRHRTFFSLQELNREIARLLERLNTRPFKKMVGTRRKLFEQLDRPVLRPLPVPAYEFAEWKKVLVNIDYHIEVDGHYYSVPYQLVRKSLEARYSERTVECFHKGQRVASHRRSHLKGHHTTIPEHMPSSHRHYAEWTPQRLIGWAEKSGPATASVVRTILERRAHPQQGFRSCLGIMRLGKSYSDERLEAACRRALKLGACSYKSIESILRQGLDRKALPEQQELELSIEHDNLRGSDYYH
ncbi:MAG: IS21 family transposase [Sulfitobacter sp.]|nr:IS21 family transposase [Sulfitobacter sp.]